MSAENDLDRRLAEIENREREVAAREQALKAKGLRHNLYSRVDISVKTLDKFILACVIAIIALIIVGCLFGKG